MSNLTLFHNGPSTCSQKVRLILGLKNLTYESKIIDLQAGEQHGAEYIKLNPNHVVPTLICDEKILVESSLILEFLEDKFPEISARSNIPEEIHQMRLWMKIYENLSQCHVTLFEEISISLSLSLPKLDCIGFQFQR